MIKQFLFGLGILLSGTLSASAVTHTVSYNITSNVVCAAGDTLKFYGTYPGDYVVYLNNVGTVINPTIINTAPYYLGFHVITGVEDGFSFSEISQGQKTGTITVMQDTGLPAYILEAPLRFFPNPGSDMLNIFMLKEEYVEILNNYGQRVFHQRLPAGKSWIHLDHLPAGTYSIRTNGKTSRLVKQ